MYLQRTLTCTKRNKAGIRPVTFLLLDNSANHFTTVIPTDNSNNNYDYNETGPFLNNVSGQQHRSAWCSVTCLLFRGELVSN